MKCSDLTADRQYILRAKYILGANGFFHKSALVCFVQEEELRKSGDTKYQHLSEELHVMVEVFAEAPDAYSRLSNALAELAKYMVPDFQDQMPQHHQMDYLNGEDMHGHEMEADPRASMGMGPRGRGGRGRGAMRGHPPGPPQGHMSSAAAARGGLLATPRGRPAPRGAPSQRGMPAPRARGAPSPAMRGGNRAPQARPAPASYSDEYSYQQPYEEQGYEYEQQYDSSGYGTTE